MSRWLKLTMVLLLVVMSIPNFPVSAQAEALCQYYGTHANGAKYCISLPLPGYWNGDLVIFAHGYVPTTKPVDIAWDQMALPGGMSLPQLTTGLGYAFATTSYSENGLAVVRGVVDVLDLADVFKSTVGTPNRIYLVGASEGGLVTTLAVEKHPGIFAGGMAMCGPIGDFRGQVNYWGNFRVLFDYFMPGLLPPSPVNIPQSVMDNWNLYAWNISNALSNPMNLPQITQLMITSKAPFAQSVPATAGETTLGVLWYNVFATNDAIEKLGGQPFDNQNTIYFGSANDTALNLNVQRFIADKTALNRIDKKYETSGGLKKPLYVLHTALDPIVPAWHASSYQLKAAANSTVPFEVNIVLNRYGHCSFTMDEIMTGFNWLIAQTTGQVLPSNMLKANSVGAEEYYDPFGSMITPDK